MLLISVIRVASITEMELLFSKIVQIINILNAEISKK